MEKSRILAFTDGVIAIVITVLVLGLSTPLTASWGSLAAVVPQIIVYAISFVIVAIYWNNHHHLFQIVDFVTGKNLWANNLFIFSLTLLPFAAGWVGNYLNHLAPEMTYGFVLLFADIAYYLLVKSLEKSGSFGENVVDFSSDNKKMYVSISMNILGLLLGYLIAPILVLVVNSLVLAIWFIPNKKIEQLF